MNKMASLRAVTDLPRQVVLGALGGLARRETANPERKGLTRAKAQRSQRMAEDRVDRRGNGQCRS
jgi:hypothetical protein